MTNFEPEWWEVTPGYIAFVILWMCLFYPPVQDIVLLGYYIFYDMGSSVGIYVEDHENGWTYWAIGEGALGVLTIIYYIYILIARY